MASLSQLKTLREALEKNQDELVPLTPWHSLCTTAVDIVGAAEKVVWNAECTTRLATRLDAIAGVLHKETKTYNNGVVVGPASPAGSLQGSLRLAGNGISPSDRRAAAAMELGFYLRSELLPFVEKFQPLPRNAQAFEAIRGWVINDMRNAMHAAKIHRDLNLLLAPFTEPEKEPTKIHPMTREFPTETAFTPPTQPAAPSHEQQTIRSFRPTPVDAKSAVDHEAVEKGTLKDLRHDLAKLVAAMRSLVACVTGQQRRSSSSTDSTSESAAAAGGDELTSMLARTDEIYNYVLGLGLEINMKDAVPAAIFIDDKRNRALSAGPADALKTSDDSAVVAVLAEEIKKPSGKRQLTTLSSTWMIESMDAFPLVRIDGKLEFSRRPVIPPPSAGYLRQRKVIGSRVGRRGHEVLFTRRAILGPSSSPEDFAVRELVRCIPTGASLDRDEITAEANLADELNHKVGVQLAMRPEVLIVAPADDVSDEDDDEAGEQGSKNGSIATTQGSSVDSIVACGGASLSVTGNKEAPVEAVAYERISGVRTMPIEAFFRDLVSNAGIFGDDATSLLVRRAVGSAKQCLEKVAASGIVDVGSFQRQVSLWIRDDASEVFVCVLGATRSKSKEDAEDALKRLLQPILEELENSDEEHQREASQEILGVLQVALQKIQDPSTIPATIGAAATVDHLLAAIATGHGAIALDALKRDILTPIRTARFPLFVVRGSNRLCQDLALLRLTVQGSAKRVARIPGCEEAVEELLSNHVGAESLAGINWSSEWCQLAMASVVCPADAVRYVSAIAFAGELMKRAADDPNHLQSVFAGMMAALNAAVDDDDELAASEACSFLSEATAALVMLLPTPLPMTGFEALHGIPARTADVLDGLSPVTRVRECLVTSRLVHAIATKASRIAFTDLLATTPGGLGTQDSPSTVVPGPAVRVISDIVHSSGATVNPYFASAAVIEIQIVAATAEVPPTGLKRIIRDSKNAAVFVGALDALPLMLLRVLKEGLEKSPKKKRGSSENLSEDHAVASDEHDEDEDDSTEPPATALLLPKEIWAASSALKDNGVSNAPPSSIASDQSTPMSSNRSIKHVDFVLPEPRKSVDFHVSESKLLHAKREAAAVLALAAAHDATLAIPTMRNLLVNTHVRDNHDVIIALASLAAHQPRMMGQHRALACVVRIFDNFLAYQDGNDDDEQFQRSRSPSAGGEAPPLGIVMAYLDFIDNVFSDVKSEVRVTKAPAQLARQLIRFLDPTSESLTGQRLDRNVWRAISLVTSVPENCAMFVTKEFMARLHRFGEEFDAFDRNTFLFGAIVCNMMHSGDNRIRPLFNRHEIKSVMAQMPLTHWAYFDSFRYQWKCVKCNIVGARSKDVKATATPPAKWECPSCKDPTWQLDSEATHCSDSRCNKKLAFGRRHHCRSCGYLFCGDHCKEQVDPIPDLQYIPSTSSMGDTKTVCSTCAQVTKTYRQYLRYKYRVSMVNGKSAVTDAVGVAEYFRHRNAVSWMVKNNLGRPSPARASVLGNARGVLSVYSQQKLFAVDGAGSEPEETITDLSTARLAQGQQGAPPPNPEEQKRLQAERDAVARRRQQLIALAQAREGSPSDDDRDDDEWAQSSSADRETFWN